MKTTRLLLIAMIALFICHTAQAQINLKLPKLPKVPKADKPTPTKPDTTPDADTPSDAPVDTPRQSGGDVLVKPRPTDVPQFLLDTVEVKVKSENTYWKAPNQNSYTSWVPQISFDLFFNNSTKVRYNAEWFNPDGSPWFSEPLDVGTMSADGTVQLRSNYDSKLFETKAVVSTGSYGVKVVNTKTSEVIFQGKFKVNKIALLPDDARSKNMMNFYVDNDWLLPTGYVGFSYTDTQYDFDPRPIVFMWFKGDIDGKDLEARLYHNGQEIATTDDGGQINASDKRFGDGCFQKPELCRYNFGYIYWQNFIVDNGATAVRSQFPKATFTRDKPGEYTVKVFHRGTQIRELNFTIDQKGWIAKNAFSNQMFLPNHRIAVPVKVTGNVEKWSPATVKADQFYGNPLKGF